MYLHISIERLRSTDTAAFFDVRRRAIRAGCLGYYPEAQLEEWTDEGSDGQLPEPMPEAFYGAKVDGQLIASGVLDMTTGEVGAMFVLPEHFRHGVGRTMLRHLEGIARTSALRTIFLDATLNAVSFYRSQGFVGEARSIFYSPHGLSLECVPMTKSLHE